MSLVDPGSTGCTGSAEAHTLRPRRLSNRSFAGNYRHCCTRPDTHTGQQHSALSRSCDRHVPGRQAQAAAYSAQTRLQDASRSVRHRPPLLSRHTCCCTSSGNLSGQYPSSCMTTWKACEGMTAEVSALAVAGDASCLALLKPACSSSAAYDCCSTHKASELWEPLEAAEEPRQHDDSSFSSPTTLHVPGKTSCKQHAHSTAAGAIQQPVRHWPKRQHAGASLSLSSLSPGNA